MASRTSRNRREELLKALEGLRPKRRLTDLGPFPGTRLDVADEVLDEGGDRTSKGSWKRRRGHRRSELAAFAAPVVGMLGFEGANEFHLLVAAGAVLAGFDDVEEQEWTSVPAPTTNPGWGEQPFGDEGFGE